MREVYLRLVRLHRKNGLLVDANLLLLLVVGRFDTRLIPRFDRTSDFLVEDYRLLEGIVRQFSRIISTPHVLTDVSNLTTKLAENVRFSFRKNFRQAIDVIDERNCTAKNAAANEYFQRVGLTDSAILSLADRQFLLLTTDFALAQITQRTSGDVVNFNHLRPMAWALADTFRGRS
jgi:hypothetical protein